MASPRLLYLGPPGSFTHAGALSVPGADPEPARDAREIVAAVESGRADLGLLPLENSVEGDVPGTLDELLFGSSAVFVRREVIVPVTFQLAAPAGTALDDVEVVVSHPHGLAQCRKVVAELGVRVETSTSTSQACADVLARPARDAAALCSAHAAALHGLQVLRDGVEDTPGAVTRMALLGTSLARPTGRDVTVAVLTPDTNRTGVLADALRCFAERDVALSRVSSRPLKSRLGTYCFVVAADGHLADAVLSDALHAVTRLGVVVKVLGSYPEEAPAGIGVVGGSVPLGSVGTGDWPAWRERVLAAAT